MIVVSAQDWQEIQKTLEQAASMTEAVNTLSSAVQEIMGMKEDLALLIDQCNNMTSTDTQTPSNDLELKLAKLTHDVQWIEQQIEQILTR